MKYNIDFEEKYKKILTKIEKQARQSNYYGCLSMQSKLTWASLIMDNQKGVFISEFLEWLFKNLKDAVRAKEVDEKKKDEINSEITKLLKTLGKLSLFDDKEKDELELLHSMIVSRYKVTQFQGNQWTKPSRIERPVFLEENE